MILRERNELFRKVESLNLEFQRTQPLHRIGESTARISHEIKNYVSVLRSNNILLRQKLKGGGEHPEVDRMARSTERLETFVRSLLDYSNSSGSLRVTPLELESVVKDCLETHFPTHMDLVRIRCDCGSFPILGEKGRLEQVFLNLLKNSLEAKAAKIDIRMEIDGPTGSIHIEDDGTGCAPEETRNIGFPFFTTKKDSGGTGLGLAIAASIIQGHGGSLEVRPPQGSPGRGFAVMISLPILAEAEPRAPRSAGSEATAHL